MKSRLQELAARGQSIWIDNLSRDLVHAGGLQRLIDEASVTGVTSNPTIFQKAISQGEDYDDQLRELLEPDRRCARDLLQARRGRRARRV